MPITDEQRRVLKDHQLAASVRRGASLRARRTASKNHIIAQARAEIGRLSSRELLVLGVIAYWAEGTKSKPWNDKDYVAFTNSDPSMIRIFQRWLESLGLGREDLILQIQIHESADISVAERFWSQVTGVAVERFNRTVLKRHNPKTVRKNVGSTYAGCLRISVRRSTELYRRIVGWYEGIVTSLEDLELPPVGRRPTGRPPEFGSGNGRSSRSAPASVQSTLFESAGLYKVAGA